MSPCFAGMAGSLAAGTSKQWIIYTVHMVAVRATVNRPNSQSAREFHEENKLELYNLKDDLSETVDVSNKFTEITSRLVTKLNEIKIDLGANKAIINENYNN